MMSVDGHLLGFPACVLLAPASSPRFALMVSGFSSMRRFGPHGYAKVTFTHRMSAPENVIIHSMDVTFHAILTMFSQGKEMLICAREFFQGLQLIFSVMMAMQSPPVVSEENPKSFRTPGMIVSCDAKEIVLREANVELFEGPEGPTWVSDRPTIDFGEFWMGPDLCAEVRFVNHTNYVQWVSVIPSVGCTGCGELICLPPSGEFTSQNWMRSVKLRGKFEKSLRTKLLTGDKADQRCTHCRMMFDSLHHENACGSICSLSDEEFYQACFLR